MATTLIFAGHDELPVLQAGEPERPARAGGKLPSGIDHAQLAAADGKAPRIADEEVLKQRGHKFELP
jgi:hypothetical protein